MRISLVTDTFPPEVNGVAKTMARFDSGLRDRGHEVTVVRPGLVEPAGRGRFFFPSVPLPGYDGLRLGLPSPWKLERLWRSLRPDIVYLATESPLGWSALRAAERLGVPVVSGYHTNFALYANGYHLGAFSKAASHCFRYLHNRTRCTFVPAVDVGEGLRAEGYHNVRLVGRGVDSDLFNPSRRDPGLRRAWGAGPSTPVAIVVGRVAPEKNLALAFRAVAAIREGCPGCVAVVVGDGPSRRDFEVANPGVIFAGLRQGTDLARHYASADVFLFPSETETFGNVLLEAMASGLVTVSYKYAASAEHILAPENGFQAPFGDAGAFCLEAVRAVRHAGDTGLRRRARRAAEAVGWDRILDAFEAGLRDALEPPAAVAPGPAEAPAG
jgi:glycosyltransferase involved in cell wall biosynthesis